MDLGVFTEPQQGATYDDLLRVARAAEDLGFAAFFRSDHYQAMGVDGAPGPTDAWVTLAGLARDTSRVRLGTLVSSATFRLPGPLAIAVAGVDQMSRGRVELGLGAAGSARSTTRPASSSPPWVCGSTGSRSSWRSSPGCGRPRRARRSTSPGPTTGSATRPRCPSPCSRPARPSSSAAPASVALPRWRRGSPTSTTRRSSRPTRGRRCSPGCGPRAPRAGRDPGSLRLSAANVLCCGRDDAQVRRRADAIERKPDDLRSNEFGGTPAELVDRLGQLAETGASRAYLQLLDLDDLDHLELVADQVLPHVA